MKSPGSCSVRWSGLWYRKEGSGAVACDRAGSPVLWSALSSPPRRFFFFFFAWLCSTVKLNILHRPFLSRSLSVISVKSAPPLPSPSVFTGFFWPRAGHSAEADFPRLPKGYFTRIPIRSLSITNVPNHLQKNLFILLWWWIDLTQLCGKETLFSNIFLTPIDPFTAFFYIGFISICCCSYYLLYASNPPRHTTTSHILWGGGALCQCCGKTRVMQPRCHFRVTNRQWQTIRKGTRVEWCRWQTAMTYGFFGLQSAWRIRLLAQVSNGTITQSAMWNPYVFFRLNFSSYKITPLLKRSAPSPIPCHQSIPSKPAFFLLQGRGGKKNQCCNLFFLPPPIRNWNGKSNERQADNCFINIPWLPYKGQCRMIMSRGYDEDKMWNWTARRQ